MYPTFEWEGSNETREGAATFSAGKKSITLSLDSFSKVLEMHMLLKQVYQEGYSDAVTSIEIRIRKSMKESRDALVL